MLIDANSPTLFLVLLLIFFGVLLLRYFAAAGLFYYYYYVWNSGKFQERRLSRRGWRKNQLKKEIIWSLKTSVIFAVVGAITYWLWQNGYTAIYTKVSEYGYWYLPLSLAIILFLHETYYYWVHRWMHRPKVFRKVHKVHHDSLAPTPWTAFSFHPWEGLLEALVLPIILLIIPVHYLVLLFYLLLMTLSSVINHLDIEVYPESFSEELDWKIIHRRDASSLSPF